MIFLIQGFCNHDFSTIILISGRFMTSENNACEDVSKDHKSLDSDKFAAIP